MSFTVVEWFVLVFAIIALIKILVVASSPKSWYNVIKTIYKSPALLAIIELILAAVLFYYLLQTMTLVEIMGVVVFGALLTGISFTVYAKELIPFAQKIMNKSSLKRAWLPLLIWLALILWVLFALLM